MQGSLFGFQSRSMTRLARLLDITRFERRPLGTGTLGTYYPGPGIRYIHSLLGFDPSV